jgi:hypothetical protein
MQKKEIKKGDFVTVGKDIGVIVGFAEENDIPEEHFGVWYGETTEDNVPLYRSVPEEYCIKVDKSKTYH